MLNSGLIAFAIIEVHGDSAAEVSARIGWVTKIAEEYGAVTDALVSGLVVISRGTVPERKDDKLPEPFSVLLLKMQSELGGNVRIAYGSETAEFGKLGDESRFTYSFIAPSFGKALAQLVATEFGKIVEVA